MSSMYKHRKGCSTTSKTRCVAGEWPPHADRRAAERLWRCGVGGERRERLSSPWACISSTERRCLLPTNRWSPPLLRRPLPHQTSCHDSRCPTLCSTQNAPLHRVPAATWRTKHTTCSWLATNCRQRPTHNRRKQPLHNPTPTRRLRSHRVGFCPQCRRNQVAKPRHNASHLPTLRDGVSPHLMMD